MKPVRTVGQGSVPTIGHRLPTLQHKVQGLNCHPQRWVASVSPLCHHGPLVELVISCSNPYVFGLEKCLKYYYRKHSGRVKVQGQTKVTLFHGMCTTSNQYPVQVSTSYTLLKYFLRHSHGKICIPAHVYV